MVEKIIGDLTVRYTDLMPTLSATDLIYPVATLEFVIGLSDALNDQVLFEVMFNEFHMKAEFIDGSLRISRNECAASLELSLFSEARIHVGVSWTETIIPACEEADS
jgi:hypothetical protein